MMRQLNRAKWLAVVMGCLYYVGGAHAGGSKCDLVTLSGNGYIFDSTITGTQNMTIVRTGEVLPITFTAVPLGVVEVDPTTGVNTSIYTHEFTVEGKPKKTFTTIDEIKFVPLGENQQCTDGPCGLVFRLRLVYGKRHLYNCGEIVSGYAPDSDAGTRYSSYTEADVAFLNSRGKLCKCEGIISF